MQQVKQPLLFRFRILWHTLFWIFCYFAYTVSYGGYWGEYYKYEAIINLELLPIRMLFTYTLIYLLIPHFLLLKKYLLFIILIFIHAFLMGVSVWLFLYYFIDIEGYIDYSQYNIFYFGKILSGVISNYSIPLVAALIVLVKWWYKDQQYKQELEHEKLSSELKYLKSQIHPHFLFNTLNNLYALTLKQSEKSADMVLRLSELLDYMLYKSNEEFVPLKNELEIIQNYISLESIRYNERLDLLYKVEGDAKNKKIAPLILLPFVENCFKHGASDDPINPRINIHIDIDHKYLVLIAENSVPTGSMEKDSNTGIGLTNVCRRLELIYPTKHKLEIKREERVFLVKLIIYFSTI